MSTVMPGLRSSGIQSAVEATPDIFVEPSAEGSGGTAPDSDTSRDGTVNDLQMWLEAHQAELTALSALIVIVGVGYSVVT